MRQMGIAALWLALAALVGALVVGGSARAGLRLQDDATPAASPVAPAETDALTLVVGYLPDTDAASELLILRPIAIEGGVFADLTDDEDGIGQVDFNVLGNGLPQIRLGDSTFDAYIRFEGDPEGGLRWTWFFDEPGVRPATLVVQVAATAGPFTGANGTATFVSRATDAGGVLAIVLTPAAADDASAAQTPTANDGTAEETPDADGDETPPVSEAIETPDTDDDEAADDETPVASTRLS